MMQSAHPAGRIFRPRACQRTRSLARGTATHSVQTTASTSSSVRNDRRTRRIAFTGDAAGRQQWELQQQKQKQQKQQQFLFRRALARRPAASPAHRHLVSALRESCRAMRRHLHGVAFWQCLSRQAFPSWAQWMVAGVGDAEWTDRKRDHGQLTRGNHATPCAPATGCCCALPPARSL